MEVQNKPQFLNEADAIQKYENYLESTDSIDADSVHGEEITYEVTSSEFLSKYGLGDGARFQDLVDAVIDTIDSGALDIDCDNFYKDDFPSFAKEIVEVAILNKEPLFKAHVECIDGAHNPCRFYNKESAPLDKMPYKTWHITKKEALTIIYDLFKRKCDVKDVNLELFLSKFKLCN